MEKHPNVSMDTVFNCVIPYIHDGDDRNSVSLVCRKWYELDCITRKHVTVHLFYSPTPSRLHQRFPFLESLTLEGLPSRFKYLSDIDITPWMEEISVSFKCLEALYIRSLVVDDSDLQLLARTRGKDLRVLKIIKCKGFSEDGLLYIGKFCNGLRTLCLNNKYDVAMKNGNWLHELALQNTGIERLDFSYIYTRYDVKDLTLLAKNCSRSLVSLKIASVDLINLVDVFRHAVRLEDFVGGEWVEEQVYAGFKFPTSMRYMGIYYLHENSFPFVLPIAHQLRKLHLIDVCLDANSQCLLIQSCPNLEALYTTDHFGDMGLQVIGQFCKKLHKFETYGWGTQMGLITIAKGCLELEFLQIKLTDISNEILECIGTHLQNLRCCRMSLIYNYSLSYGYTPFPVDDGIRAMLIGCSKLERLSIHFQPRHGGLTDVGLGYIGKYGHNLRHLSLGYAGESDAGLVELSKGCPKLRKLEMVACPFSEQAISTFVFNIHSLRCMWVRDAIDQTTLTLTRPNS